ncbi:hypothetical protein [Klebsiella michiganensis]
MMLNTLKTGALRSLYRRPMLFILLTLTAFWGSAGMLLWKVLS